MAKWKSVIFSDIRNKLGNQVVFSNWKGRGYMRAYVTPANPQTNAQKAHRAVMANLVAEWKGNKKSNQNYIRAWNNYALDYGVSGYNLFVKFGRKASIQVPATASGSGSAVVTITFDLGVLGADGRIIVKRPDARFDILEPETTSGTYDYAATTSGSYEFWIASDRVYWSVYEVTGMQFMAVQAGTITKWHPDENNGVAKAAICNVTIS